MTDPTAPHAEPGWYPDPWSAAPLRYFDGIAWTQHTHGGTATPAATGVFSTNVVVDAGTPKLGRAGMICAAIYAVVNLASTVFAGASLASFYHEVFNRQAGDPIPEPPAGAAAANLVTIPALLLGIAALVLMIMWSYRNAITGRKLGIPSGLAPGWAIGSWFIPLAHYILPYFSIAGAVPEALRPNVRRWWIAYAAQFALNIPVSIAMIASLFSGSAVPVVAVGAVMLVADLACAILQVIWGYELTAKIHRAHTDLAGQRNP